MEIGRFMGNHGENYAIWTILCTIDVCLDPNHAFFQQRSLRPPKQIDNANPPQPFYTLHPLHHSSGALLMR